MRRQSQHMADYATALEQLDRLGVLYPCFCTRQEIAVEITAAANAPHEQLAARPDWADERQRPPFLIVACSRLAETAGAPRDLKD